MKTIRNDTVIPIDVDDTLILYPEDTLDPKLYRAEGYIKLKDITGETFYAKPSMKHIRLMKLYRKRGFTVIVWSGNGYEHAESIVKQLKLSNYVDLVMCKPNRFIDDVDCSRWMGTRIYLEKGEKI